MYLTIKDIADVYDQDTLEQLLKKDEALELSEKDEALELSEAAKKLLRVRGIEYSTFV